MTKIHQDISNRMRLMIFLSSFYSLDKHFQNQIAAVINNLLDSHHLVMDVPLKAVMRNFKIFLILVAPSIKDNGGETK